MLILSVDLDFVIICLHGPSCGSFTKLMDRRKGLDMFISKPSPNWSKEAMKLETPTLWLFNIAMENGPFIDGLPGFTVLKTGDFPWQTVK